MRIALTGSRLPTVGDCARILASHTVYLSECQKECVLLAPET